ncbi:MAG TPA: glycerol-3-phosphate 1-O-acyltransferase PlsY [Nitrospinota bacterium]|nr:glycerol-3-phosphate 1-O-acyltransferase PlsY [Nitrospinota bacterium]
MFKIILLFLFSYLLGSIPFGYLIAKREKINVRNHGSGNIGATNVLRTVGKKAGILTLTGDFLKGFIPVLMALYITQSEYIIGLVGILAILGHIYPIFLKFKGGKGVATSLGVFTGIMPLVVLITTIIWLIICFVSRYVSLSSMIASIALPVLAWQFNEPKFYILLSTLATIFIIFRHKDNLRRLATGEEDKFNWKR